MSQLIGFAAEKRARDFLIQQGLHWITSNYRCKMGEIDLIMRENNALVFVEVRARRTHYYGNSIESITYQKRQKLIRTASWYLLTHQLYDKHPCRFDVLSLQGKPAQIHWIKHAFSIEG